MELTEFLFARIAEDEAAARAALTVHQRRIRHLGDGKWGAEYYEPLHADEVRRDVVASIPPGPSSPGSQWTDAPGTELFKRFDPARVLAQCTALRAVVERHAVREPHVARPICDVCWNDTYMTLRALASIWAGAPGFDPEWRLT